MDSTTNWWPCIQISQPTEEGILVKPSHLWTKLWSWNSRPDAAHVDLRTPAATGRERHPTEKQELAYEQNSVHRVQRHQKEQWYPLLGGYTSTRHAPIQLSPILKAWCFTLASPTLHATHESGIDWMQGLVTKVLHWNLLEGTFCSALWVWALLRASIFPSVISTVVGPGLHSEFLPNCRLSTMVLITLRINFLLRKTIFGVPCEPEALDLSWPVFHSLWGPGPLTGPQSL